MASNLTLQRRSQRAAEDSAAFGPVAERFRRAGDLDRAVSLCREGLQKFPHHVSARVTLGWSLLDLGKYDEARVELETVLRRAPDNLAAIRGLAELHDRAEHTLSLPMDGPGQWPPTEDAVNEAAATEFEPEIVHVPTPEAFEAAAQFAGEAEIAESEPEVEQMAVFTAQPEAAEDAAEIEQPQFETAHAPQTYEPQSYEPQSHQPTSYEPQTYEPQSYEAQTEEPEIVARAVDVEPFDVGSDAEVAFEPEVVAQEQAEAAAFAEPFVAPQAEAVSAEADIAALLAEAEKLEAAAVGSEQIVAADEGAPVEFGGEPMGNIDLDVLESEVVDQPQAMLDALQQEESEAAVAKPVAELLAEPVAEAFAEPVAEAFAEPVAEGITELAAEPCADDVFEPVAAQAASVNDAAAEAASVNEAPEEVVATIDAAAMVETGEAAEALETAPLVEAVAATVAEAISEVIAEPMAETIE